MGCVQGNSLCTVHKDSFLTNPPFHSIQSRERHSTPLLPLGLNRHVKEYGFGDLSSKTRVHHITWFHLLTKIQNQTAQYD